MVLGFWLQVDKYVLDLLNEVLNIGFGTGAAKISEIKVGGRKKYLPTRLSPRVQVRTEAPRAGQVGRYFFDLQL